MRTTFWLFVEFLKYKLDKGGSGGSLGGIPGLGGALPSEEKGVSGMLWVHLLAGRGLRSSSVGSAASTPVTPSGSSPGGLGEPQVLTPGHQP